jgi:hypothetical protein
MHPYKERQTAVESLARRICRHDGLDPDEQVVWGPIYQIQTPSGMVTPMPSAEHAVPLWHSYAKIADLALFTQETEE